MSITKPVASTSFVPKRRSRRSRPPRKNETESWLKAEIFLKLAFNSVLSIAAIAGLIKLLPYQFLQQQKLKEVRVEVQDTENRVNELRNHWNRNFDPQQTRKIMQEQSPMIDPNQRRIILVQEDTSNPIAQPEKENTAKIAARTLEND